MLPDMEYRTSGLKKRYFICYLTLADLNENFRKVLINNGDKDVRHIHLG